MIDINNYIESAILAGTSPDFAKRLMLAQLAAAGYENLEIKKVVTKFNFPSSRLITALSTVQFFQTEAQNGFPLDEHFLVLGIRLFSGASAALGSTPWVPGMTDAIGLNGNMNFVVNGTTMLKDMPLTSFTSSTNNADVQGGFLPLERPILIAGTMNFTANLNFPTVVATATFNTRIHLEGIKLI